MGFVSKTLMADHQEQHTEHTELLFSLTHFFSPSQHLLMPCAASHFCVEFHIEDTIALHLESQAMCRPWKSMYLNSACTSEVAFCAHNLGHLALY